MTDQSSTFKAYSQDFWPIQDLEIAQDNSGKNPTRNKDALNYLAENVKVLDGGKTLAIAASDFPDMLEQGKLDIVRCGSSLASLTFVDEGGQFSPSSGVYNQMSKPEEAPDGILKEDQILASIEKMPNQFLASALLCLPNLRSQGMFTFQQYLMGNALSETKLFNMSGLSAVSNLGFKFDDYCKVEQIGKDGAAITTVGLAYDDQGQLLSVMYRQITMTKVNDEYHFGVQHHYILPEQLHKAIGAFTPLTEEDQVPDAVMQEVKAILAENRHKDMKYAKDGDTAEEIAAGLPSQVAERARRLTQAQAMLQDLSQANVQESFYLQEIVPAMAACAQEGVLDDVLLANTVGIAGIFQQHPGIAAAFAGAMEYGGFVGQDTVPSLKTLHENLIVTVNQVAHAIFRDDEVGQSFRDALKDSSVFCENLLGKAVSDALCGENNCSLTDLMVAVSAFKGQPFDNGVHQLRPCVSRKIVEIEFGSLGYDGEGSKGKYLKPLTKEMMALADQLRDVDAYQGLVKQIDSYSGVFSRLSRAAHNARVWVGKTFIWAFGWGDYAEDKAGGPAVKAGTAGILRGKGVSGPVKGLANQVNGFVKAWIPESQTPGVGGVERTFDQDHFNQLVEQVENGAVKNRLYLGQQLIGAGLYHFLVGDGKNAEDRNTQVMGLVGKLGKLDRPDFNDAKSVMISSRQYLADLFDHRLDATSDAQAGNPIYEDEVADPLEGYSQAKADLFKIVLEHELSGKNQGEQDKILQELEKLDALSRQGQGPVSKKSGRKMPVDDRISEAISTAKTSSGSKSGHASDSGVAVDTPTP